MKKICKLDIVFLVGPFRQKTEKQISRMAQQLTKSVKDCRIASIHFDQEYKGTLGRSVFRNYVFDFSNVYSGRDASQGNPPQYGYPLQHVSNLSFRHDATRICFLISDMLPFNDVYEETLIYNNEIGQENPVHAEWDSNVNTENPENNEAQNTNTTDTEKTSNSSTNSPNDAVNREQDDNNPNENKDASNPQENQSTHSCTVTGDIAGTPKPKTNEVYHEDQLQSCRYLAAMGVVLYCIENVPNSMVYKDMYSALSCITGGQYMNISGCQLQKAITAAILEEVCLESLIGNVRDYLCVAWLAWGRMKAKKPSCFDDLCKNVLNYLHKINITKPELLLGGKALDSPSKHAKKMTTLRCIGEARRLKDVEENWAAEISWLMPEVCDEVIPGYDTISTANTKKNAKKVTLSKCKPISRNQVMRVLVRTLARRPGMIQNKQQAQVEQKTNNSVEQQGKENNQRTNGNNNELSRIDEEKEKMNACHCSQEQCKESTQRIEDTLHEVGKASELSCQEQLMIGCKQDSLITEKLKEICTKITCNCVVV